MKWGQINSPRVAASVAMLAVIASFSISYGRGVDWTIERMPSAVAAVSFLDSAIRAATILVIAWAAAVLLHEMVIVGLIERRIRRRVPEILAGLLAAALYLVAFAVIATEIVGLSVPIVLASVAGLIILLGAPFRGLIEDLVAGVVLSFDRTFGIGVIVETPDGHVGRVLRLGLAGTSLALPDGNTKVVRNSSIGRQGYILHTASGSDLRQSFTVTLPHYIAAPRAVRLLKGAALATKGIGESYDPQVRIEAVNVQLVSYRLNYGVPDLADAERIRSDIAMNLLRHLTHAGISLIAEPEAKPFDDQVPTWDSVDIPLILDRLPIFSVLTAEERRILSRHALLRSLPEGAVLCRTGGPGGALFILAEGVLEVTAENQDGVRVRLARVEPGECVGEMSLLTGEPRSADVFARSPVLVLEIRSEHLSPILENRPSLAEGLASLMAERQRVREELMSASAVTRARARVDLAGQIAQKIKSFFSGFRQ